MSERFAAEHIVHAYGANAVLHDVGFEIVRGQVTALVGENGSGKSTLLRIMTGAIAPTGGRLRLDGQPVTFSDPAAAQEAGIAVVHQDYNLVHDLTVAENVYSLTHRLPRRGPLRRVDQRRVDEIVEGLLAELDIRVAPGRLIRTLDAVERKFVEIARAMVARPDYLVLDEPTASLEPAAAARVLDLIGQLRAGGTGVALVSHRLDEIVRISDRITVLRDGRPIADLAAGEVGVRALARLLGGTDTAPLAPAVRATPATTGRPIRLRLRGARLALDAAPLDLTLHAGEILGLTGLLASGAGRVVARLGGAVEPTGDVEIDGVPVAVGTPIQARRAGIGYIAEDRKGQGLVPDQSVAANIALASLDHGARGPWLNRRAMADQARRYCAELDIRPGEIHAPVRSLSGGNQQKVLLARWLASGVTVLVVDEPTHGVDVAGKAQIHALLRRFADGGGAVIVASTDVHEVLELCDRVGVLRHGTLVSLGPADGLSHADLTMLGVQEVAA